MRRWLRRIGIGVAALLAVIALAVVFYTQSPWGRDRLRGVIESQAERFLAGELKIASISGSIFGGITLSGVELVENGRTEFQAARIDVGYDLAALLRGGRSIGRIVVVDPVVHVVDRDGQWNVSSWLKPRPHTDGPPAPPFVLSSVEIQNGRVLSDIDATSWRVPPELRAMDGNVTLRFGGGTLIDIHRLAFETPDRDFVVRAASGRLTFADDSQFEHLTFDTNRGSLTVSSGRVGPGTPHTLAFDVTLDRVDTPYWRRFTSFLQTIDLVASGPVSVGGSSARVTIAANLKTSAGAVRTSTVIVPETDRTTITGTATLAHFDAQHVAGSATWKSDVTGDVRFTTVGAGTPAVWTVDAELHGGPVRAFDVEATRIDGTARYADDRVTFDTAVHAYGAEGRARGTVATSPALAIDVTGEAFTNIVPKALPAAWGIPALDAVANAQTFAVSWREGAWSADAVLAASTVEGAQVAAGTDVHLTSGAAGVTLRAEGDVRDLDARRMGRALAVTALDDERFETRATGHVRVTGRGATWADIDLQARAALVDSDAGRAHLPRAELTYARQQNINTARIVGSVLDFDPAKVGAPSAAAGSINGQTDVTVSWDDGAAVVADTIDARVSMSLTPSTFVKEKIDSGRVSGEWRDGQFNAQTIELDGQGLTVSARGRFAVSKGASSVTFEAAAKDVVVLEPWIGRAVHGDVRATGQLSGAFDRPRLVVSATSPQVSDADLGVASDVTARVDLVLPDWNIDAVAGEVHVTAQAVQPPVAPASVPVSPMSPSGPTAVPLSAVAIDGRLASSTHFGCQVRARRDPYALSGAIAADWAQAWSVDVAEAQVARGKDAWRVDLSAGGVLRFTGTRVTLQNIRLTNGQQSIGLDGATAWKKDAMTVSDRVTLHADRVDLSAFDRFFDLQLDMAGQLTADVSLVGDLGNPRGRITLDVRGLSVRGYTVQQITGDMSLGAGLATVQLEMTQPNGMLGRAEGRLPIAAFLPAAMLDDGVPRPDWDLRVATEPIDLKLFSPLVPTITDISGQAIADLTVTGAAASPSLTGTVAMAEAAFKIPAAGAQFAHLTADFGFTQDVVEVRRFAARDKHDHALTVTGKLAVGRERSGDLEVNLETDHFNVLDNDIGVLELSSLLRLSGSLSAPKLTGNVEVVSGRIEVDRLLRVLQGDTAALVTDRDLPPEGVTPVDLKHDAEVAAAAQAAADAAAKRSLFNSKTFLSGLTASVRLVMPDNLILRGRSLRPSTRETWSLGDLNVTVGGELMANRTPGSETTFVGDVNTVRGVYSFQGRRFDIQRDGHIRFVGGTPPNPRFDIRAIRNIQGVEARVDVKGTLSDPQLELGSNLPLDEADILSMIVFNAPVNQLADTQRADLVGTAASLAGGFIASPLAQTLGRALNLDLLEVETVTFGQNVSPRIRVGQQVTNRLFVQFAQQFGPQSLSELTAEYQLARFLRLQADTTQGPGSAAQRTLLQRVERFGLDLTFFFNY